jgi:protoporphyrinogen oxidase
MADAIIIGVGYAGMSAAALLACVGRKVIVLEASDTIGGRALSYMDEAGYIREYGVHSHRLSHRGIANDVFRRLGDTIDFLPEAKDAKLIFKGRLWERPEGLAGILKTPMLSFGARLALLALLIRIKKADPGQSPTDLISNAPPSKNFIGSAIQSGATAAPATSAFPPP